MTKFERRKFDSVVLYSPWRRCWYAQSLVASLHSAVDDFVVNDECEGGNKAFGGLQNCLNFLELRTLGSLGVEDATTQEFRGQFVLGEIV